MAKQAEQVPELNVDPSELQKFASLAHHWWDPNSEFRPLHEINPLRLDYIDHLAGLQGKQVLDVGCGGGILSNASTTANIQHLLALQPGQMVNIVQPQWIDLVQWPELAVWIPPVMRQRREFLQFGRIDVQFRNLFSLFCHDVIFSMSSARSIRVRRPSSTRSSPATQTWLT